MELGDWCVIEGEAGEASRWQTAMESILARGEGFAELDPWLERLAAGGVESHLASGAVDGRLLVVWIVALLARCSDSVALEQVAAEGYRRLLIPLEPEIRSRLGGALLLHGLLRGGCGRLALVTGALWGGVGRDGAPAVRVVAHLGEAIHAWRRGRSDEALKAVRTGLAVAEEIQSSPWASPWASPWVRWLRWAGVALALGRGEVAAADLWLRGGRVREGEASGFDLALHHLFLAWRGVVAGEAATTVEVAEVAEALATEVGVEWLVWAARLVRAEALALRGEPDEARRLVVGLGSMAEGLGGPLVAVSTALTEACLAAAGGDEMGGQAALQRGLAEARTHRQRVWVGQHRAAAAKLMAAALRDGVEGEEARGWIRGWNLPAPPSPRSTAAWPWPVRISTLGQFRVVRDGAAVTLVAAGQRRPLDLLRAMLACGGREVRRERLADLLWPEADGDAAQRALATTLHRLRRLLGDAVIVRPQSGMVGLDATRCWVDAWAVEELLAPILTRQYRGGAGVRQRVEAAEGAIDLYRGPFLHATGGEAWLLAPRERLHGRLLQAVERVGRFWEEEGELERAIATFECGLEVDDLEEGLYQGVIRGWLALERRSKAVVAYRRCEAALGEGLGVEPSRETKALLDPPTPLGRKRAERPRRHL